MDSTDVLDLPFPSLAGSDTADVPRDIAALAEAVEAMIVDGAVWHPGDIKYSAQDADHGRWLLCDGRELTAAEVVTALGLNSGEADALAALLVTGASSKYGNAASGKFMLPDMRDKFPLTKGSTHPLKGSGSAGGVETVTLTAGQSGIRSHTHGVTDAGHTHGVTDPGHAHGASSGSATPAITINSGTTGISATTDSKTPVITAASDSKQPTITITDPGHVHEDPGGADFFMTDTFSGFQVGNSGGQSYVTPDETPSADTGIIAKQDAHTHTITATQASHNHAVTVTDPGHTHTASQASHSHSVSVSSTTTGLTVNSATTGISINNASSAPATDAHDNMPPYRTIGSAFMRV